MLGQAKREAAVTHWARAHISKGAGYQSLLEKARIQSLEAQLAAQSAELLTLRGANRALTREVQSLRKRDVAVEHTARQLRLFEDAEWRDTLPAWSRAEKNQKTRSINDLEKLIKRQCCEETFGKLSTLECEEVESGERTLQSSRAKEAELRKGLLKRIPGDELLECLPDELQEEIDSSR